MADPGKSKRGGQPDFLEKGPDSYCLEGPEIDFAAFFLYLIIGLLYKGGGRGGGVRGGGSLCSLDPSLVPVVRSLDNFIQWINPYPAYKIGEFLILV